MDEQKELPTLSDVVPEQPELLMELKEIDKGNLINQEFTVEEIYFLPSQFGEGKEFSLLKIVLNKLPHKVAFGSAAIVDKLKKVPLDKIPFTATLRQKKSEAGRTYYVLE